MQFKHVPVPASTPRIQARRSVEAIERDYQRFMLLFWEFHCNLEAWRATVDTRLQAIEKRIPR